MKMYRQTLASRFLEKQFLRGKIPFAILKTLNVKVALGSY